jgi:uncharacterized membrane protein YbhN (UPF0104 family)
LLLPALLSLALESLGWKWAFASMGRQLPFAGLFRARIATEALAQTLPFGVVFCEGMKPLLLARTCGASLATSLAGIAARKWLLVTSQGVYVGMFALLGWSLLTGLSRPVLGGPGLSWLLLGACVLARGQIAERLYDALTRLPVQWLRERLHRSRAEFAQTDGQLQQFFASLARSPLPLLVFLLGWLLEASETFLILWLLGVDLPLATVGVVEVSSSFLRNVAVFVPAGLGVQDLSYVTFLRALEVPHALDVAAAFLLLKRAKECFWSICGYVVLALDLRAAPGLPRPVEQS